MVARSQVTPLGSDLLKRLEDKSITKWELAKAVEKDFRLLPSLINGVSSPKATIRYGCSSVLLDLSQSHPEKLYPYFNHFAELLGGKYRILTWNATAILANLSSVDVDDRFESIFDKYFGLIEDGYMVTVANVVGNSGKIALAKPHLTEKIVDEILRVDGIPVTPHLSEECRRVIAEKAIETFDSFCSQIKDRDRVLDFASNYLDSPRSSLRIIAGKFIAKWGSHAPVHD